MVKRVTSREVARAAGVSPALVSRVMTGKGHVAEATSARIREAAAALGVAAQTRWPPRWSPATPPLIAVVTARLEFDWRAQVLSRLLAAFEEMGVAPMMFLRGRGGPGSSPDRGDRPLADPRCGGHGRGRGPGARRIDPAPGPLRRGSESPGARGGRLRRGHRQCRRRGAGGRAFLPVRVAVVSRSLPAPRTAGPGAKGPAASSARPAAPRSSTPRA